MVKIIVTQDLGLTPKNIEKLKQLGDLTIYDQLSKTPEEWLERCQKADIICTACPFCMVMMTDGIKYKNQEEKMKNYDIAELVSMGLGL